MHLREIKRGICSGAYRHVRNLKNETGATYGILRKDRDVARISVMAMTPARPNIVFAIINPQKIELSDEAYGYIRINEDSEITLPYEGWEIVK